MADERARIETYSWAGGCEAILRFGPDSDRIVVVAMPLFEEANRTRTFVIGLLRALAARGVAGALPDLPGQGESLVPLETLSLLRIAEGYEGAVHHCSRDDRNVYGIGIRSGALLDKLGLLAGRWHLAPQDGPSLLRDLTRIKQTSLKAGKRLGNLGYADSTMTESFPDTAVEIAGNLITAALLTDLSVATPRTESDGGNIRTVRLRSDPRAADEYVVGTPLWRRSEPGDDRTLADLLADDIARWIARCEG